MKIYSSRVSCDLPTGTNFDESGFALYDKRIIGEDGAPWMFTVVVVVAAKYVITIGVICVSVQTSYSLL